jgi:3-hydroxyisobutyrate dehydrogenase-like beta-hydroxyacid dehydrogenase
MYDVLLDSPASRSLMREKARRVGVRAADTFEDAAASAQIVISAVTAASSSDVAAKAAGVLRTGQLLLDINSVSPAKKLANAAIVAAAGADYVEAAVMAPVPPQRLRVPMLLGGPRAAAVAQALCDVGMNATALSDKIGVASAVKMCRSIVIKGLEALTLESMLAARRFGAEQEVLASLNGTFPSMGWTGRLPDYLISRVAEHGLRRASEMREVARTLSDVGVDPVMAAATASRQEWLVKLMAGHDVEYAEPFSWRSLVDAISPAKSSSE